MKKAILISFSMMIVVLTYGQVTDAEKDLKTVATDTVQSWKTGGIFTFNFAQTSLSHWAAGGENSVAGNGLLNIFANYKSKISSWDNSLAFGYGFMKRGSEGTIKTDDRVELNSKYGRVIKDNLYYAVLMNFKTQMAAGYNYPNDSVRISNFLAPAYILVAAGLNYKPVKNLDIFFAPLTGKITIVNDKALSDSGAFGVSRGDVFRQEFGGYLRMAYRIDLMENISLQTKADFFSNYLKKPQNIDVNWDVLLSMKVNKFISATFSTSLIYDDDVLISAPTAADPEHKGPRTQFKEILGIGFSYKFLSK